MQAETVEQHKRKFSSFLELDEYQERFDEKLKDSITSKKYRFVVDINQIRSFENDLANKIIQRPREYILALQEASIERCKKIDPSLEKALKSADLQVGFEGSFGQNAVSPRGLTSQMLNSLVQVEGIVTKCSNVRPKLTKSVHYCPVTKIHSYRDYLDNTSISIGIDRGDGEKLPTSTIIPTKDKDNNELELEYGLCKYKDYQSLLLQEMPEKSKVGQLPRSVDVLLEYDLVDRAKPGDRIVCVGVYRTLPTSHNGTATGSFRTVLLCNNISILGKEIGAVKLTGNDIKNIKEISQKKDILEIMSRSLCPSIFGHEFVKKALILQLLGGCERNLENGTHLRGDINLMMVGDPSTAKSQLLRAVLDIAPLAISTTGRGSTGVGLTAAVTIDSETGDKRLEAGAMVLADRGIVCIDEFDKMSENDRVAIHEVMEQQTVTIAKAGIHASLNARSSVLAAANPVYGQYDKTRRPQENIGLPDSLLSRFDLLFIVLDQLDPTLDRILSEHVIKSHQYRRPGTLMEPEALNSIKSINLDEMQDSSIAADTPMWQKGNRVFNDKDAVKHSSNGSAVGDLLTKDFLRKYIHYAKSRINPILSTEAMNVISTSYANMRAKQSKKNLPVTARTLETMIRLSSASAKSRLSNTVEECDVDAAMELMTFVLFHEFGIPLQNNEKEEAQSSLAFMKQSNKLNNQNKKVTMDIYDDINEDNDIMDNKENEKKTSLNLNESQQSYQSNYSNRLDEVQAILEKMSQTMNETESINVHDLIQKLNYRNNDLNLRSFPYTFEEVELILRELEKQNKIMYDSPNIEIV